MSAVDVEAYGKAEEAKTVTIIVNGRPKTVPKNEEITFDQVVALAFPEPADRGRCPVHRPVHPRRGQQAGWHPSRRAVG